MTRWGRRARSEARDDGVTLVEVLVGMGLFGLLTTLLLGFVLSTSKVSDDTRQLAGVNEESRLAMERLTRELRQADAITELELPSPPDNTIAVTFWTDFNGNGNKDLYANDPEVLTYRWTPSTKRLTLTANDPAGNVVVRPVLAANVSNFSVDLFSSLWAYDTTGDGLASWQELDAAGHPVGNGNRVPDVTELERVDLVTVSMTVLDGPHAQTYRTQVGLRNRSQS